nr:uncharacterized protein LOC106624145 isoform X4 [Bactrocera oleae]
MSSWARRAADISSVVTSCGHPGASTPDYTYRLEKVKFGVPLEEVCKNNENIPGPLLVLILKLNKESPNRRDVFRAPGHQGAMKKLIHFLQSGRLVNVDNYSVYTIASVLKKFLRKIPNGIFGRTGEKELFDIIELENESEQMERLHRLFTSLPKYTQRLLVLLFGTFRVIASNATQASTGMTSEALGVSVAPSFFQSCVSDGKTARMEDVLKFKVATKIMKQIIDKFATHDLFGRENYEYYARVTGRILKVQDEWICSFQYPPPPRGKLAQQKYALQHSLEAEKTWLQCQCERWGLPTKPVSTHYEPHQRNHQHFSFQTRNIDSHSYLHRHSQSSNHQRQHQAPKRGSKLPSHYHSTDSVRYCDVDLDVEIVTEPTIPTSRLFYSPRKQIFSTRRCNSTHDLYKIDVADAEVNSDLDHNYLTYSLPSDHNQADFGTVTVPSTLTNRAESCEIYSDSSEFLNASLLDNSLATVSSTSAINDASGLPLAAAEEVDFIPTSRYRQSTPRVQRRQQRLRRRQRLSSTSTQYHSMNSTNASSLLMTTADGGNGSESVGNIRLSNSAESIQYPLTTARRPSTRRLIGVNVPRQYPLRSSLRRNREKQVGSGNTTNGSGNSVTDNNGLLTEIVGTVGAVRGMLPVATAPPSVRNSIAECCSNIETVHDGQHILVPAFPFNRLEDYGSSLERKRTQLRSSMDDDSERTTLINVRSSRSGTMCEFGAMLMDSTKTIKGSDNVEPTYVDVSGNNNLVYATTRIINNIPTLITTRNMENVVSASTTGQQESMSTQNQSSEGVQTGGGVSTITFKVPRV